MNTTKNNTRSNGQCPSCGSYCDISTDLDDQDYCNDCRPVTSKTPAQKWESTVELFRNGFYRYDNDPIFKQAIDSLVGGVGVYAVLDSVLRRLSHQSEVVKNLKTPGPTFEQEKEAPEPFVLQTCRKCGSGSPEPINAGSYQCSRCGGLNLITS